MIDEMDILSLDLINLKISKTDDLNTLLLILEFKKEMTNRSSVMISIKVS